MPMKERLSSFPDKKQRLWTPKEVDDVLIRARLIYERYEVGQKEGTFVPYGEYRNIPQMHLLFTDPHYGSTKTDTERINKHLKIVKETPNFFMHLNGDDVDNFNATGRWASGMMEDPFPPQLVSRTWALKVRELDRLGKIGVMGFGNHNDFAERAGHDWYESFLSEFQAPIFTTGGLLHMVVEGKQYYSMAMTHKYWGTSKLNPTNACKRFLSHEWPQADILFLGHTHQCEGLHFERGGKDRVAVIGGTYKDKDTFAAKHGIAGRAGSPGWVVALWPNERRMQLFKDVEVAQQFMLGMIFEEERKAGNVIVIDKRK